MIGAEQNPPLGLGVTDTDGTILDSIGPPNNTRTVQPADFQVWYMLTNALVYVYRFGRPQVDWVRRVTGGQIDGTLVTLLPVRNALVLRNIKLWVTLQVL